MRAAEIAQPDVGCPGGISRTLRVARMAEAAGLAIRAMPHCANLSLVTLFTRTAAGGPERREAP